MKRIYIILLISLFALQIKAQAPGKMSYQAVVRDANSLLIADQVVGLQLSVLQGSSTGTAVFTELHTPTTNVNGLLTIEIGTGSSQVGSIAAIDWEYGPYFLKSEIDINGGTNYNISGVSEMLSVPYSFYAKTAGNLLVPVSIDDLLDGISDGSSVFLGDLTGANNIGYENIGIGIKVLRNNISGSGNTSVGFRSSFQNTTGSRNTANGKFALYENVSGNDNTAYGHSALHHNVSGKENTVMGSGALLSNFNGSMNVAVGYEAGRGTDLHNNTGSVFLGYKSGYFELGDNRLYIENSNSTTPLIYGEFDNDLLRVNGTLDINDEYQFPMIDGTNGQVLETDGNGVLSWATSSGSGGAQVINDLQDGITSGSSVFLGDGTGVNDNGDIYNRSVGIGIDVLHSSVSGYDNTAIGYKALNANASGSQNTSCGGSSLLNNTTGFSNSVIGYFAMMFNVSGGMNTANGGMALHSNIDGNLNTGLGYGALSGNFNGSSNTAVGAESSHYTNGSFNTTLGQWANRNNINGSNNTIIGYMAGHGQNNSYHDKSGCVFIGYKAGRYELGDNKLYIENSTTSFPLIYGEFDNDFITINGNLGVGTQSFGGGSNALAINTGNVPTSSISNGVLLYSALESGSSELIVMDEAGHTTTLSPHNFSLTNQSEPMAWSYYSKNAELDMEINVDMLYAMRLLEEVTGEKLVYIKDNDVNTKTEPQKANNGVIERQQAEIDELKNENKLLKDQLNLIISRIEKLEK